MTEKQILATQAANTEAIQQGKAPIIKTVSEPTVPADNEDAPDPIESYLPMLSALRKLRFDKIGTKTLVAAAESLNISFNSRKHLFVFIRIVNKSGSTPVVITFNNDTGTNYIYNVTANNPSSNSVSLDNTSTTDDIETHLEISNIRALGKMILYRTMRWTGTAAGSSSLVNGVGAWDNKASQITSIQVTPSAGGGVTFGAGSVIEVFGHD